MSNAIVFTTGADNRPLIAGLNEAGRIAVQRSAQIARRMLTAGTASGVAIGTAIVSGVRFAVGRVGAVLGGVQGQFNLGGSLNDLKSQTGIAVGDLFLLQQAFKENGLGANMVGGSVNRMQRQIALATNGNKAARKTFTDLGLSWTALRKLAPYEQFQRVAESIAAIPDPSDRANLAKKMFGGAGGSMQALFANIGSMGDIGKTLGPQAAALNASAAQMDEAGDKLDRVRTQFEGFYLGIATQITDQLMTTIAQLEGVDFLAKGRQVGATILGFVSGVKLAWNWIGVAMEFLRGGFAFAGGVAVWIGEQLWDGIGRAMNFFASGFSAALAGVQTFLGGLLEGLLAIPLDLQTGLQFAFQQALQFFGNGFWDLIADVSAGMAYGLQSAITGLISILPDKLKSALNIEDIAPVDFKVFQAATRGMVGAQKTGYQGEDFGALRARNFASSPLLRAGMKAVEDFRDRAAKNMTDAQAQFARVIAPPAGGGAAQPWFDTAWDFFKSFDEKRTGAPTAGVSTGALFGPSAKEMGVGDPWRAFRSFRNFSMPMIQGSSGIQGAVGGLANPAGAGGVSGGAYGLVRKGDAARRRAEKEAETEAAQKKKSEEKGKTAEGTNQRLDETNGLLSQLLEEFQ